MKITSLDYREGVPSTFFNKVSLIIFTICARLADIKFSSHKKKGLNGAAGRQIRGLRVVAEKYGKDQRDADRKAISYFLTQVWNNTRDEGVDNISAAAIDSLRILAPLLRCGLKPPTQTPHSRGDFCQVTSKLGHYTVVNAHVHKSAAKSTGAFFLILVCVNDLFARRFATSAIQTDKVIKEEVLDTVITVEPVSSPAIPENIPGPGRWQRLKDTINGTWDNCIDWLYEYRYLILGLLTLSAVILILVALFLIVLPSGSSSASHYNTHYNSERDEFYRKEG